MAVTPLTLLIKDIKDPLVRENFYRLSQFIQAQPLLLSNFTFFNINIPAAATKFPIPHGLSFVPSDIIDLGATGNQNYEFLTQEFDQTNIYVTTSGPAQLSFFAGLVNMPGYNLPNVEYPYVAPSGGGSGNVTTNPPTVQEFLLTNYYTFTTLSANATVGATYTNNSQTFTVVYTISGGTILVCSATGAPTASGALTKASGGGDATITFTAQANHGTYFPTNANVAWIRVRMVGGGAGGAGSGTSGGPGGAGGGGGNTTFGTSSANGGTGGGLNSFNGGAGGSASLGTGAAGIALTGGSGGSLGTGAVASLQGGGMGGSSAFGGAGSSGGSTSGGGVPGGAAVANSGGGGGGAGSINASVFAGCGGGAGGYVYATIIVPATSYTFTVGAGGPAGTAGTTGYVGGAGGSGSISIEEYYSTVASTATTPTTTPPTTTILLSGSGTYIPPVGVAWLRVRMVGGGAGGGGGGTSGGGAGGAGTTGNNTTFGAWTANGGSPGGAVGSGGGGGGSFTLGSSGFGVKGGNGQGGPFGSSNGVGGGEGGSSVFGGAGSGAPVNGAGTAGQPNTGGGGGGGGNGGAAASWGGSGGGSGGYVDAIISSPATSYSYGVAASVSGGTAGTSGFVGGGGASGMIIIEEYYPTLVITNPSSGNAVPSGTILPFGGSSAPSGYLLCNGAAVSRTTFANLFSVISTTYGVGDGVTTFNVPNAQGVFLRGAGSQAVSGITYTGTRGTTQGDQLQGHAHVQGDSNSNATSAFGVATTSAAGNSNNQSGTSTVNHCITGQITTDGTNGTPRAGAETRPANISVNYIIAT